MQSSWDSPARFDSGPCSRDDRGIHPIIARSLDDDNRNPRGPATAGEPFAYVTPVEIVVPVRITALAFREEDGRYSVVVPELPGCVTMGDSIEEVQAMIADAAEGWLAVQHEMRRAQAIHDLTEPMEDERS